MLGGLLRDLAPDSEDVWRFSPFFDLSLWRLARHKDDRPRSIYHVGMLLALVAAEFMRYLGLQVFGSKLVFTLYTKQSPLGTLAAVGITTIFTISVPLKIWNSARNERLLEAKERLLVQARLAALSTQINPHFLFNTLNTVSSLIRTNPEKARQVVYRLSSILRRLLSKSDNFAPLRDELAFIDDYLSIEIARFGDKLRFSKEIDDERHGPPGAHHDSAAADREQHPARARRQARWRLDPAQRPAARRGQPAAPPAGGGRRRRGDRGGESWTRFSNRPASASPTSMSACRSCSATPIGWRSSPSPARGRAPRSRSRREKPTSGARRSIELRIS